jgi:hypothetical protein
LPKQGSNRGKGKKEVAYSHKSDLGSLELGGNYDIDSDKADAYLYEDDIDNETHFANMSGDNDNINLYLIQTDPVPFLTEYR